MSKLALRALLWFLGVCLTWGSRWVPALRSQITRSLTVELAAGDGVARHWIFNSSLRHADSYAGPAAAPDCRVQFASSGLALRCLTSALAVDRIVAGFHDGSIKLEGSAFVLLWYYGLTRIFVKLGRPSGPRYRIPHAYLRHDPKTTGAETIIVEPAVQRLDPEWRAAWRARATLPLIRVCTDEYFGEP